MVHLLASLGVEAQTKYPTTANYCDMVCYGGLFGYTGECCMESYCYCQTNGNFFLYCPTGQSWCPERNTCIQDCFSDCQCANSPSTTTTTSPSPQTSTTYPWETTTTTRYPSTTTTYPWETTTTTFPAGVCPNGWIESVEGCFLFQYAGDLLWYWQTHFPLPSHSENQSSWREAQHLCESQGGFLAEIKSEEQQAFLVRRYCRGHDEVCRNLLGKCGNVSRGVCRCQVLVYWADRLRTWGKVKALNWRELGLRTESLCDHVSPLSAGGRGTTP